MLWLSCLIISIAFLVISLLFSGSLVKRQISGKLLTPFNVIFLGVFIATFIGVIPVIAGTLHDENFRILKLVVFSVIQTIQIFTVNVGFDFILDNIGQAQTSVVDIYSTYMTCLFIAAPLMTFGFIVSLFENTIMRLRYTIGYYKDVYIFNGINESSLMLADDIKKNNKNVVLVFTDVDMTADEENTGYIERAKTMKALIFENNILSLNFKKHSKKAKILFFFLGENESENVLQSLKLISKYKDCDNMSVYVSSTSVDGEVLLSDAGSSKLKVRRVDAVRSVVYSFLHEDGYSIFENAHCEVDKSEKQINAVIVGLGDYGTHMLKTLIWYCQMDGYSLNIHAFDKDELAEEKFSAMCPEVMSDRYNGQYVPGESQYKITIHSGVDVKTKSFVDIVQSIDNITFAFVSLGSDEENICQSLNLRMLCERYKSKPVIRTVVFDSDAKHSLNNACNFRKMPYNIGVIGDVETLYSQKIIIDNELEKLALARHLKWGNEDEFYKYEYNYRSSMASAIHMEARIKCQISGADKREEDLTDAERDAIENLEHRRWNAYMRSEGYVYSGSPDAQSRNDLAKMHHNLVEFNVLSEDDKRKDSKVGTQ